MQRSSLVKEKIETFGGAVVGGVIDAYIQRVKWSRVFEKI